MVSFASLFGAAPLAATGMLTVAGAGGLIGRIAMGLKVDRFGAQRVLIAGLALQAVTIALYAVIHDLMGLFALSVFFGIAYGGVMRSTLSSSASTSAHASWVRHSGR